MNERIRRLAEQAITEVDVVYEDNPLNEELAKMYIPDCFAEKFAELIVQECVQVLVNRNAPNVYGEHIGVEEIKQHFGVK